MARPEQSLGLESGKVILVEYRPDWVGFYERERVQLQCAVGHLVIDIQHVGSTSIPQTTAKPILDIGIAVNNFEEAAVCIGPVEKLGYEYRGESGIPRRRYFVKGRPSTHHVHMVEIASAEWRALIYFRDYLREHPNVVGRYVHLKQVLAKEFAADRKAYQRAKASFIAEVIAAAEKERLNA